MKAALHLALLRTAGLRPKKSFGQNFLVSDSAIATIARACVPESELGTSRVVELGAGAGALTAALLERAACVTAIERDRDLVPLLEHSWGEPRAQGTLLVLEADAQTLDLDDLFQSMPVPNGSRVLAGNLPYQITGQLLRLAIEQAAHVDRVVFMVQREVAERLVARPATKAYGALTVFVTAAYEVAIVLDVPPDAFVPPPSVASCVVCLVPLRPPLAVETETFRAVVKAAFAMRRKTLRNAWRQLAPDRTVLEAAASVSEVSLDARGETLDVSAFDRVARALTERSATPLRP